MKGLKRNLRYWLGNMELQVLAMVAVLSVVTVLMAFMEGANILEIFGERFAAYMIMIMFIFTFWFFFL